MQGIAAKTAREMGKGSNRPLEERVRRCVERHGRQRTGAELEEWQVIKDWGSCMARVACRGVGVKPLIWVASHQAEGQAKDPCEFVVSLNEAADKAADEAMHTRLDTEPVLEDVNVPSGISRFYVTWRGRAVTQRVGDFIRRQARERAQELWAERKTQGAVARELKGVYEGVLPLGLFTTVKLPIVVQEWWDGEKEGDVAMDRLMWKIRNGVGGSQTALMHTNAEMHDRREKMVVEEVGESGAELAKGELEQHIRACVCCKGGGTMRPGTFRHGMMTCEWGPLVKAREELWGVVERRLCEMVGGRTTEPDGSSYGAEVWARRGQRVRRQGEWVVDARVRKEFPVLGWLGWLVPMRDEEDIERFEGKEKAYDLGYRAVVPVQVAENLFSPAEVGKEVIQKNAREIAIILGVGVGRMRRMYVMEVRRLLGKGAQAEGEQTIAKDDDAEGKDAGGARKECKGKACQRSREDGNRAGMVVGKAGVCKGCKRQERKEWTVERVAELVQGSPEKYKYEMVSHEQVRREIQPLRREAGNRAKPYEEDVCTGLRKVGITHLMADNRVCWAEKRERWEEECGCSEAENGAEECDLLCKICARRRYKLVGRKQVGCMRCAGETQILEWCTGCGKPVHNACIPACWRRGAGQQGTGLVVCGVWNTVCQGAAGVGGAT